MTKLLYDVCAWWYEGLRASPEWVRIVVVALMFGGLWVVFTRPVLKEQRRKVRWLGYGVAVVDVGFMTFLSVWTWHFLGVPWATRALVPIKGQEPAEVVSWYVTSRENWFFEDARVFRYLEEVDPNWAKHEDAWRLLPGILRGVVAPEKVYAAETLAELTRQLGSEFFGKLVAKFPADWSRSREASTVLRAERGKLAEKEKQAERLQLVAMYGSAGRDLIGDLVRAWVETKGDEALYPKTLAAINARWAGSAEADGRREWLESKETEAWIGGDEGKRGRAEVVLRRVVEEWKPDRRAKEGDTYRLELAEGVRVELGWIVPGEFIQGSPASESGRSSNEGPQRRVRLTKGYWLGKTEVTQGDWGAVMGSNPSYHKGAGKNYPVEWVSWEEAMAFCRKVTERDALAGRLPSGYEYRLPTEAQWEYACRAGTTGPYAGKLEEMGWYDENSGKKPHPVGEKQGNAWGLHDMHGNVWEWCLDWYGGVYAGGSITNPMGPASGSDRVFRGGGWGLGAARCRSADRFWSSPSYRNGYLGFRLALAPSP